MEDSHSQILSYGGDETAAFLAVFDGHGGGAFTLYWRAFTWCLLRVVLIY